MILARSPMNKTAPDDGRKLRTRAIKPSLHPITPESCESNDAQKCDEYCSSMDHTHANQFESLNLRLDKLISVMEGNFAAVTTKLNELQANFTNLSTEVQNIHYRINTLEENVALKETNINNLSSMQLQLEKRVKAIEKSQNEIQKLEQYVKQIKENEVASDLIVRGIPMDENINLSEAFKQMCITMDCPNIKPNKIFRLKNSKNSNGKPLTDAGIIVKLSSPSEKSCILKAAANFRKKNKTNLLLNHAGVNSSSPIYINECLTKEKKQLLNAAVQHKRKLNLYNVFTFRGNVFAKKQKEDQPIEIQNMEILNNLTQPSDLQQQFFRGNDI